ncbi:MAG: ATP-binding protein [Methanotrichaceae archaeon]|nr:ATP-binding protein [Methanotrichaceae archaeon]
MMEILAWFGKYNSEKSEFEPFITLDQRIRILMESGPCPNDKSELRNIAKTTEFIKSDEEYNYRVRETAIALVRRQLELRVTEEADLLQAVEALDDLNLAINLLDERLYEWSRLHIEEVVHGKDLANSLSEDKTMGELAKVLLGLRMSRQRFEVEIGGLALKLAPNLTMIAGSILATRLISKSGGLRHLNQMPSSAVQILGAEKALFKHLKGKAPSPKHGLIFRHPAISGAPKRLRGKIARAIACKLTIAARLDFYGGGLHPELMESLEKRITEIRRNKGSISDQ